MRTRLIRLAVALAVLASAFGADAQQRLSQQRLSPAPVLLKPTAREGPVKTVDPTVIRSQNVIVNFPGLNAGDSATLTLPLFDGESVNLVRDEIEKTDDGGFVWGGHVDKDPGSDATLSAIDGLLIANITTGNGKLYQIRYAGGGVHVLREIDRAKLPPEGAPRKARISFADTAAATCTSDPADVIDVLVVYTEDAQHAAGGGKAMLATARLAKQQTNHSYANSNVTQRIQLAGVKYVAYPESNSVSLDLERLGDPSSGFLDDARALRDTLAADLTVLIVETGGCGESFQMETASNAFESKAYSVMTRGCAVGKYTFAHELGHLMGARHDWVDDANNNSPFAFNHGYVNKKPSGSTPGWRTIMAVEDDCFASGAACERIQYWSNPNVNDPLGNEPMGVASGDLQSDNHQVLNKTALFVANFRCSLTSAAKHHRPAHRPKAKKRRAH